MRTMSGDALGDAVRRRRGRLALRVAAIAAGLLAAVSLWTGSDGGSGVLAAIAAFYGGGLLLALWAIGWAASGRTAAWAPVLAVPACVLAVAALEFVVPPASNPLFRLRFRASEARLTEVAERALQTGSTRAVAEVRRIGLLPVLELSADSAQVRVLTTTCGLLDRCGLAYVPAGDPAPWFEDRFAHVRGDWHFLVEGF